MHSPCQICAPAPATWKNWCLRVLTERKWLAPLPVRGPVAEQVQIDPDLENTFICHLHDHWFCIRKVNGEWYNFDSLYAASQHLSKFYLAADMDSLKNSGWSIFLVRGNFPKEFPIASSEVPNGYGQWVSPEDAERITKSCNTTESPQTIDSTQQGPNPYQEILLEMEDQDLKAAIAASLMESSQAVARVETGSPQNDYSTALNMCFRRLIKFFGLPVQL